MSIYQKIAVIGSKYIGKDKIFKYGFNLSPMYRRSTGRLTEVSENLLHIKMKLSLSYKNRNYVNSIFGGSLFSAVDPIPMVQLINIIGDDYVVWDKSAQVFFKRPAKENVYAEFDYSLDEVEKIKADVEKNDEIEIVKTTFLTSKDKSIVYCEVRKTIYVATKKYYREKRKRKEKQKKQTV